MRKIVLAAALATTASLSPLMAGGAQAIITANGNTLNAVNLNAVNLNGFEQQGTSLNGFEQQGTSLNGFEQQGTATGRSADVTVTGIRLPSGLTVQPAR